MNISRDNLIITNKKKKLYNHKDNSLIYIFNSGEKFKNLKHISSFYFQEVILDFENFNFFDQSNFPLFFEILRISKDNFKIHSILESRLQITNFFDSFIKKFKVLFEYEIVDGSEKSQILIKKNPFNFNYHVSTTDWYVTLRDVKIYQEVEKTNEVGFVIYEYNMRKFVIDNMTKFDGFIDVGANIGIWSKELATNFRNVYSFEMNPRTYPALVMNTLNIDNINLYHSGLGAQKQNVLFYASYKNSGGSKIIINPRKKHYDNSHKCLDLKIHSLDSYSFENISLIKIDVEGYEYEVLKGSIETISKNKPWVVVEINDNRKNILNYFKNLKYNKPYEISKNYFIFTPQTEQNFITKNHSVISENFKKLYNKLFN